MIIVPRSHRSSKQVKKGVNFLHQRCIDLPVLGKELGLKAGWAFMGVIVERVNKKFSFNGGVPR